MDFNKAFDNVWHEALFLKLARIGVTGRCYSIIKDMYTNTRVCGRSDSGYTHEIPVLKGVLQGNVLSPTLFNIFINDITDYLIPDQTSPEINSETKDRISCLLYADDVILMSTTRAGLQNKLNQLDNYCCDWGLQINTEKTKVVVFTRNDPKTPLIFSCGNNMIQTVEQQKYLGIVFHKNGTFHTAQEHLVKQANKAWHSLKRAVRGKEVKVQTMTTLFDTLIKPIMTYGAEVWFPYSMNVDTGDRDLSVFFDKVVSSSVPCEDSHVKFCRSLLGVHKKAAKMPVLAELGRYPLSLGLICQTVSFWIHITESNEDSYLKQAYKDMLKDHTQSTCWVRFLKNMLYNLGLGHVWQNQSTMSHKRLKYTIMTKLEERYEALWRNQKENSSKLRFYNSVTDKYNLAPYLPATNDFYHRQALARLRISAHDLQIEKGRYTQTPQKDRKCPICDIVEDELHFLDDCKIYSNIRARFLDIVKSKLDHAVSPDTTATTNCSRYKSPSSLIQNDYIQTELAAFVYDCFEARKLANCRALPNL